MTGRRIYLDHAATTPMLPEAIEAMTAWFGRSGNASSLHGSGRAARRVVEESREEIAQHLGADPVEVVFTSGGTEADNLALKGAYWAGVPAGRTRIVTSAVEHHAVLDTVAWLESQGATIDLLDVDDVGLVDPADVEQRLSTPDDIAVLSVMRANNEVGAVQRITELAELAAAVGVRTHADAVQAVGHHLVDFADSGLDAASVSAHKFGGPYGIGALLARREFVPTPVLHGGGQERDLRSGTVDVAAAAGFAAAIRVAVGRLGDESVRLAGLRDRLVAGVVAAVDGVDLNGPIDEERRLPGIANISFAGCEADAVLMMLDAAGIDCSTGSACSAGVSQPSHVLRAMGRSEAEARSSLRFSLGHTTTEADVDALVAALPDAVLRARRAGSLSG